MMQVLKRSLGILWMLLGPAVIVALIIAAVYGIDPAGKSDINKPLPWMIVISVFTPIAIGFSIFGWYAWKGEYTNTSSPGGK